MKKRWKAFGAILLAMALVGCVDAGESSGQGGGKTKHTYGELVEQVDPTCTEDGVKAHYDCPDCDKIFDIDKQEVSPEDLVLPALGHDVAETWTMENGKHFKECNRCHAHLDEAAHSLTYQHGTPATHEEGGEADRYTCDVCGGVFADAEGTVPFEGDGHLPALGHDAILTSHPAVAPTCQTAGSEAYWVCSCGALFADAEGQHRISSPVVIPMIPHDLEYSPAVPATCEGMGSGAFYECSMCHNTFEDAEGEIPLANIPTTPALGHDIDESVWAGNDEGHYHPCKREGCDGYEEIFPHECDWVESESPTYEHPGAETGTCSVCGMTIEREIPVKTVDPCYYIALHHGGDDWEWDNAMTVVDDEKCGYLFKGAVTESTEAFVSSIDTATPLGEGKAYKAEIINDTDHVLDVAVVSREWNYSKSITKIGIGERKLVTGDADVWNHNTLVGPAFRFHAEDGGSFAGNVYVSRVEITDTPYYNLAVHPNVGDWIWTNPTEVVVSENGFAEFTNVGEFENASEVFMESLVTDVSLSEDYYVVEVGNETNKTVRATARTREWGDVSGYSAPSVLLEPGAHSLLAVEKAMWNQPGAQGKIGIAIRFAPSEGGAFSGKVSVTAPKLTNDAPVPSLFSNLVIEDNGRSFPFTIGFDPDRGYYYSIDASKVTNILRVYYRPTNHVDPDLYQGVALYIYNGGEATTKGLTVWHEDWNGHYNGCGILNSGWNRCLVTADTWNGGDDGAAGIGLYDAIEDLTGEVRFTFGELVPLE